MEKGGKRLLLLTACFLIGVTAGSVAGLGSGARVDFAGKISAGRYACFAILTNLPFFCCVFLPGSFVHRLTAGSAAVTVKGVILGCASVFIFALPERELYYYSVNILPQLLCSAPALIAFALLGLRREEFKYTYSSVLTNFCVSCLVTFLVSCVQFAFFFVFSTMQLIFVTNF